MRLQDAANMDLEQVVKILSDNVTGASQVLMGISQRREAFDTLMIFIALDEKQWYGAEIWKIYCGCSQNIEQFIARVLSK